MYWVPVRCSKFVNHPVSVFMTCRSRPPFSRFCGPNKQLTVTVRNVSGNLFTTSGECECLLRKYHPLRTCNSYNSQMNATCRTACACSLCPPPEPIGDPISRSGFVFSTSFRHLARQSTLLRYHIVESSVTGPPRRRPSVSRFFKRESCTHPQIPLRRRLSSHCCCYCCWYCPLCQKLLFLAPLCLSLLFDWCTCHLGLLF